MDDDWDEYWTCSDCSNDVSRCVCGTGRMSDKRYKELTTRPRREEEEEEGEDNA